MRVPSVKFTIRRMMVAVAIVALALGGAAWWRRTTVVREPRIVILAVGVTDLVEGESADGRVEHEPRTR